MIKTRKFHALYIGNVLSISLGLLALLYLMLLHKLMEVTVDQDPELVKNLILSMTIGTVAVGALITFVALLSAHRVSGVHIKLKNTFERVAAGDMETQLRFRKNDHLEDVEDSFNQMMESLRSRLGESSGESEEA
jgi:methyl-accepting chemotaxis protein